MLGRTRWAQNEMNRWKAHTKRMPTEGIEPSSSTPKTSYKPGSSETLKGGHDHHYTTRVLKCYEFGQISSRGENYIAFLLERHKITQRRLMTCRQPIPRYKDGQSTSLPSYSMCTLVPSVSTCTNASSAGVAGVGSSWTGIGILGGAFGSRCDCLSRQER